MDRGAIGLLCEHFIPELIDHDVVQTRIAAGTMRPVMARLAAAFYGYPARDLLMIGVTGTNGKTTVTQLLGDLLSATGRPTNVMGTLSGTRTTPEATEVQRVLAGVRDRQKSDGHRHAVAMEVSSHALVQSRVEGIHFDVAVFTNLSHDHLDYHGTMEEYFEAKAMLFTPSHALRGVVNADDPWGRRLLERARIPTVAVHHADATDVVLRPGHSEFTWRGQRISDAADRRHQRRQRAAGGRGRARPRGAGARARGDRRGPWPTSHRCRAGCRSSPRPDVCGRGSVRRRSGRRAPSLHGAGRLRPHAGRARGGARRGARRWRRRGGCSASSAAAGTGTGPSGP